MVVERRKRITNSFTTTSFVAMAASASTTTKVPEKSGVGVPGGETKKKLRHCSKCKPSSSTTKNLGSTTLKKVPRKAMNRFNVGQHCEIKRSDGRIHGAVIVGFSEEEQLVKVEWYEEGETKGKEVDYYNLLNMNPILNGGGLHQQQESTTISTTAATGAKKSVIIKAPPPSLVPPKMPIASRMKTSQPKSNNNINSSIEANKNLRRTMPSEKNNFVASKNNGISPAMNKSFIKTSPKISRQKENYEPMPSSFEQPQASIKSTSGGHHHHHHHHHSSSSSSGNAVTAVTAKSRQQSEERRIKNSEAKRQKYLKFDIDKSNPNWQFLGMINEYRSQIDFRPISPSDDVIDNRISVCIRKRPLDKREIGKKELDVVTVPNKDHVIVHQPQQKVDLTKYLENQKFRFDYAFDEDCDNEIVYQFTTQPLIKTVFEGGYATVFAYGQTGSGKTHTMSGAFHGKTQDYTAGIYALTAEDFFQKFSQPEFQKYKMTIKCSFFEIYGSKVFDLLGKRTELRILEDEKRSVQIVGLSEVAVNSPEEVMDLIKQGSTQRSAGTTSANANSSRSHAVFQFILRRGIKEEIHGKFSLIDLAGNERGADTNSSDKQTRREGAEINKSLLALKECIRAMAMNKSHIPFRYSKLTLVLRDSFNNENAKTCMIGMVSPGTNSVENTLNTLRYADRVKELGSDEDGHVSKPLSDAELMLEDIDEDEFYIKPQKSINNNNNMNNSNRRSSPTMVNTDFEETNITKIRNAEEKTFEDHHAMLTVCDKFEELMQSQNDTDNDVERYARMLILTCERGNEAMNNLKDSAKDLLSRIQKDREQPKKKSTRK